MLLEDVLGGNLQKSGIRCVVLKELRTSDLAAVRAIVRVGWITEGWVVQEIEGIHAKRKILFSEGCEVLEERHIQAVISGTIDRIGSAAQERDRLSFIRNR